MRLSLLNGVIAFALPVDQSEPEAAPETDRSQPKGRLPRPPQHMGRALRAGRQLLSRLLSRIRLHPVEADIDFGFEDPADTGMIFGLITPLTYTVPAFRSGSVNIRPDFGGERLEGRGRIGLRLVPITLLPPMIAFGWSVFVSPRLRAG